MNSDAAWRSWGRGMAWLVAGTFLVASVMLLLLSFNITAPEPTDPGTDNIVDNVFAFFENESLRWPQDLAIQLLFAVGFAGVAALGPILRHLIGRDDPGPTMLATALLAAGLLGVVAQLVYIGMKEVAIVAEYCDCEYAAHQLIARREILEAVGGVQQWLNQAFIYLFSFGLLLTARHAAGILPAGLLSFSRALGIAGIFTALFNLIVPAVADAIKLQDVDVGQIGLLLIVVVAGILTPIWAAWLARSLPSGEPSLN
jgi:hypothetical protein